MNFILATLFMFVIPLWIYIDATNHGIGKIPEDKSTLNISAGAWVAGVFILYILFVPLYLFKRSALLEKAKVYPVMVSQKKRVRSIVIICIVATMFLITQFPIANSL